MGENARRNREALTFLLGLVLFAGGVALTVWIDGPRARTNSVLALLGSYTLLRVGQDLAGRIMLRCYPLPDDDPTRAGQVDDLDPA